MIRFVRPAKPTFGLTEIYGLIGVLLLFTARFIPIARWYPFWGCPMRKQLGIPCRYVENLVLEGLARIALSERPARSGAK